MKKPAFYLLELLVYILLSSILSLLICSLLSLFINFQKSVYLEVESNFQSLFSEDFIRRDLSFSSNKIINWDITNFVFKINSINKKNEIQKLCIGWKQKGNKLIRKEGEYSFRTNQWIHSKRSMGNTNYKILKYSMNLSTCKKFINNIEFL